MLKYYLAPRTLHAPKVRRELARLRRATEGVSADEFHRLQRELADAQRAVVNLRLEMEAAQVGIF